MKDLVKCGCDEYPECTHVLYWHQGFKAGMAHDQKVRAETLVTAQMLRDARSLVGPASTNPNFDWWEWYGKQADEINKSLSHDQMSEFDRLKTQKDAIVARELAAHDQKVREHVLEEAARIADAYRRREFGPHGAEFVHCDEAEEIADEIRALAKHTEEERKA